LLAEIKEIIAAVPTYGYRRIHAVIRRRRREQGGAAVNAKRVYRVMKTRHCCSSARASYRPGAERRHDGRVAGDRSDAPLVLGRL
jgi:putative transposase